MNLRSLAKFSVIVFGGFVASRLLGLVRNMVVLGQFGDGPEFEAYVAAISVTDVVFQVLAGGAVGSAFIPVFKGYFARQQEDEAWRLTSAVMTIGFVSVGLVALGMAALARPLMDLLVPGREPAFRELAAGLLRTMLVTPALFAVSCFATSVLNSFHRFALAALAPIVYNLGIIFGAAALHQPFGIFGLAYGVVLGALGHLLVQVPGLVQQRFRFRPRLDLRHPGVREVGRLMVPRMLGLGVVQLNLLVNLALASFLAAGAIAYLNVAWQLVMMPLVLAMAVSTAAFPTLAEAGALDRRDELRRLFVYSLRMILFLTIPMAFGLAVLGEPLVRLLFERGEFDRAASRATAFALALYAVGLAGHAAVEIAARVFYALHDTWTPVRVATGAVALNVALSLALMRTPLDYGGLALANGLAALVEAGLALRLLSGRLDGLNVRANLRALFVVVVLGLVMAGLALATRGVLEELVPTAGSLGLLVTVGGVAAVGAAGYLALALILRLEEVKLLLALVRRSPPDEAGEHVPS